jgi:hypothetical protein
MKLFEFFDAVEDSRYTSDKDKTIYDMDGDTRKSRLTLEMINQLRHHIQARREEKRESVKLYQKMYGQSVADMSELA